MHGQLYRECAVTFRSTRTVPQKVVVPSTAGSAMKETGRTPGLRVPLRRSTEPPGFLLLFGPTGARVEQITDAQAMTLLTELARAIGLVVSGPAWTPPT